MKNTLRAMSVALAGLLAFALAACGGTAGGGQDGKTVTVYTVDGLEDWYAKRFEEFKAQTGITVQAVTAGSGEVASRVEKEKSNTKADLLVTLPPFIQRAASQGLLAPSAPSGVDKVPAGARDPRGRYAAVITNYLDFVYNPKQATPPPKSWDDLLDPGSRGRSSTPRRGGR